MQLGGEGAQAILAPAEERDGRAVGGEAPRRRGADPARGAGDDGDAARERLGGVIADGGLRVRGGHAPRSRAERRRARALRRPGVADRGTARATFADAARRSIQTPWATRHNRLGEFLRARRALVTPEDVGLPDLGRRRVAGLRREELALLAGVSVDYYVRLEQGRDRHPSEQVLDALARALCLDDDATAHLHELARPAPRRRRAARARRTRPAGACCG